MVGADPPPASAENPAVGPELDALVTRLLAKDPAGRPASAAEVAGELGRVESGLSLVGLPVVVPESGPDPWADLDATEADPEVARRPRSRSWALLGSVLAFLALSVVFGAAVVWRHLPPADRAQLSPDAGDPPDAGKRAAPAAKPALVPITLKREDLGDVARAVAGDGDPARCPPDLVGVFGDPGFRISGQTRFPAYSPDGSLLAVPSGNDVVLFDTASGRRTRVLRPELNP